MRTVNIKITEYFDDERKVNIHLNDQLVCEMFINGNLFFGWIAKDHFSETRDTLFHYMPNQEIFIVGQHENKFYIVGGDE